MELELCDLEKMFDDIKEIINYIEFSEYKNRRYRLFLGNGDRLNLQIPNESIAHLLGINTTYLISTGRFNSKNSFEALKEMCENPFRIDDMHMRKQIDYSKLFSQYVQAKVNAFRKNISIDIDKTELVCKYDSKRAYLNSEINEKYDYILLKKHEDGKIGLLCLVKNNNTYQPMSNQIFDSFESAKESLNKYLSNQEITTLTGVNLFNIDSDYNKTFNLSLEDKIKKIKNIIGYKNLFNCSINISGDYIYTVDKLRQSRDNYFSDSDLINLIVESIKDGKLIDGDITRDTNLTKIIESFNDYLCKTKGSVDESVSESYTSMKNNLEYFKNLCEKLKKENEELTLKNNDLEHKTLKLESENADYKQKEDKILKILLPKNPEN